QDCVSEVYQLSDLVLLLSEKESFGLTLLEAMKTGVGPIGSNAGGIKEVIKHGETGCVVDVGDSDSASDYAIRLLEDKVLYNKLQKNMLADIAERLTQREESQITKIHQAIAMIQFKLEIPVIKRRPNFE
ncbi:fructose-bisphosphatase class III, partial [Staphylococcus aureus]|uniref:fructose-bisphosphatase class III n=1 Tax=Staphylococcus aureus TaxID=1280 RepID=UPI00210DBE6C